jgi:hypothetical protein
MDRSNALLKYLSVDDFILQVLVLWVPHEFRLADWTQLHRLSNKNRIGDFLTVASVI